MSFSQCASTGLKGAGEGNNGWTHGSQMTLSFNRRMKREEEGGGGGGIRSAKDVQWRSDRRGKDDTKSACRCAQEIGN